MILMAFVTGLICGIVIAMGAFVIWAYRAMKEPE